MSCSWKPRKRLKIKWLASILYPVKLFFMLTFTVLLVNIILTLNGYALETKNLKIKDIMTVQRQDVINWMVHAEKKYKTMLYSNNVIYQVLTTKKKAITNDTSTKPVSNDNHLSTLNDSISAIHLLKPIINISTHQNLSAGTYSSLSSSNNGHKMGKNVSNQQVANQPLMIGTTIGRLGNQIFEFISSYIIAQQTGHMPAIDAESSLIHYFKNLEAVQINLKHSKYRNMHVVEEKGAGVYTADIVSKVPRNKNVRLCCYFQSWKYYIKYKQQIWHQLQLRDFIYQKVRLNLQIMMEKHLNQIKTNITYQKYYNHTQVKSWNDFTYIGLHVRLEDFTETSSIKRGYTSAPVNYIINAMQYYRQRYPNVVFITCSDDIKWCKDHISNQYHDIVFTHQRPIYDFATLSSCNHSIITTGSFGWWTGWLTGGKVVYYSGFPVPNTEIGNQYIAEDYYPPEWIPMK